ncbi:hypothetical protein BH24ACT4_BH24ACT4_04290 [soil metagenome]
MDHGGPWGRRPQVVAADPTGWCGRPADVVAHTYPGCAPGVDVTPYSIEGGGHTWPGSDIIIGPPEMTTQTIDATEILLDWFAAHPLPTG